MTTDTKHTEHDDRIPAALQTVCLASNRGEEVNVPPPRNMAFKGRSVSNVLASNRGEEVNVPPPRNMAFKWRSVSNILASNRGEEVNVPPPRNKTFKGCVSKVFSSMLRCKTKKQACEKPVQLLAPIVDEPTTPVPISPQEFLDTALKLRGYSTQRYTTFNSGYSNMPTPLQVASYDVHILKIIMRDKDEHGLREILTCGISPNPCKKDGESLLHKVCKSGQDKLLQVFLACGADVRVSDSVGRTPLHDACWGLRPSFKTFELLLQQDPSLIHMMDGGGNLPLTYVREDHHAAWNVFLGSILDIYWSPRDASSSPPPLALLKANSRPVVNPGNALSLKLAKLVSSGRMEPEEAIEAQRKVCEKDGDGEIGFHAEELAELPKLTKVSAMAA